MKNEIKKILMATALPLLSVSFCTVASDSFAPGDSDSKWVVGAGAGYGTNIYAGEDEEGFVYPNVEYRGERLFFKDGQLGLSLMQWGDFSTGLILSPDVNFLSDEKEYRSNAKLAGLKERDNTVEGGFYINHTTDMGRLRFTALTDAASKHDGQTVSLSYTADLEAGGWNINPYLGVAWMSEDKVDHLFGVSAAEANSDRAAYAGKNTSNLFAGVRSRYAFNKNWDLNLQAGVVRLGEGIYDSSIVDEKNAYHGSVGVSYNF